MSFLLLAIAGLSGCSDDDYSYVEEFDDNIQENMIGTWHIVGYYNGWGKKEEYNAGEVIVTFTKDGMVRVINKREDQHPIRTSTFAYFIVDIEKSIFTGKPRTCISFGYFLYNFTFDKDILYLSMEAYDGDGYALRKLK